METTTWTKLPAIKSDGPACLTCGCGAHDTIEMGRLIAVGFGDAGVTRDGLGVYSEQEIGPDGPEEDYWTVQRAEDEALKDPDHDWRIYYFAPLYEAEYQRHSPGHWVLIRKGMGFA